MERDFAASAVATSNLENPKPHMFLEWKDLTVDVSVSDGPFKPKHKKRIIHGSHGCALPGEVLAVLGPSGAGKTSLFNALALRGRGYETGGQLTINGRSFTKSELQKVSGFVFQDALFHSYILVEEMLMLAADLKLPKVLSREEKRRRVDVLLDAFDLRKCARTRIGNVTNKGISGGEKKRLSIAVESITGPSILFLDEPTSGLDASSSLMIVKLLKELAASGTTVVVVLHQPRPSILRYIDKYLILSDGRDIYFGDLPNLLAFFEFAGIPVPLRTNPLDFALDVINTSQEAESLIGGAGGQSFANILRGTSAATLSFNTVKKESLGIDMGEASIGALGDRKELAKTLNAKYHSFGLLENIRKDIPQNPPPVGYDNVERSGFGTRLAALLRREFLQKLRNPEVMLTQIMGAILLGLIMGGIYFQQTSVYNQSAMLSFAGMMSVFIMFHVVLTFSTGREIFLRERESGLYSSAEYYISTVVSGLPGDLFGSFLLGTILYWMVGLRASASAYFTFIGIMMLLTSTGASLLYASGAFSASPSTANSLASLMLMFCLVLNGFFILYNTIPSWIKWVADVNFMRFGVSMMYFNQFNGQNFNCTPGVTPNCIYATGSDALIAFGVPLNLNMGIYAVYILIVWACFHILGIIGVSIMYTGAPEDAAKKYAAKRLEKKKRKQEEKGVALDKVEEV